MSDDQFDANFTWYEWSFVNPEQVPTDDLHDREAERHRDGFGWSASPDRGFPDRGFSERGYEERRWR